MYMHVCLCKTSSEGVFGTLHVLQGGPMTPLRMMRYFDNSHIMRKMTKYCIFIQSKVTEELNALEKS